MRRLCAATAAAVVLVLAGLAVPLPTAGEPTPRAGAATSVRVAAVQGNVPEAGLDFNAERRAVLDNHANATRALAAAVRAGTAPRPDLVLWPENSSDIDPYRNADARDVIQAAVDDIGVPTLVGAVLRNDDDTLSNAGIVWSPRTGAGERYLKQHPVPFGEYIPYRDFFRTFSDKVDLVARDFVPGGSPGRLAIGPAVIGDVICFEVAYDDIVTEPVRRGATLLVVQTNNATFGLTDESVQQLAMSRLRAIETGRAVVHISTVGVSAIVAPDGRVVARGGHFTSEVLQADVPLRGTLTVATRLRAGPEVLGAAGALLVLLPALTHGLAKRRARRETTRPAGTEGPA